MNGNVNTAEALAQLKAMEAKLLGGTGGGDGFAAASVGIPAAATDGPMGCVVNVTVIVDKREYPVLVQFGPQWVEKPKGLIRSLLNMGWNLKSYPVKDEAGQDGFANGSGGGGGGGFGGGYRGGSGGGFRGGRY